MRDYFFDVLYQLRGSVYEANRTLVGAARDFSAIATTLEKDGGPFDASPLETADAVIKSGSHSFSDLLVLYTSLGDMVRWFTTQLRKLVDGYPDVVGQDIKNWLEYRR
jgi:hypothetical protein